MTTLTLQNREPGQLRPHVTHTVTECYTPLREAPISTASPHSDQSQAGVGRQARCRGGRTLHRAEQSAFVETQTVGLSTSTHVGQAGAPSTARTHKGGHSGRRAYYILWVGAFSLGDNREERRQTAETTRQLGETDQQASRHTVHYATLMPSGRVAVVKRNTLFYDSNGKSQGQTRCPQNAGKSVNGNRAKQPVPLLQYPPPHSHCSEILPKNLAPQKNLPFTLNERGDLGAPKIFEPAEMRGE